MKNLGLLSYCFRHQEKYIETEGSDKLNRTIKKIDKTWYYARPLL
jgi:hypothetical protein